MLCHVGKRIKYLRQYCLIHRFLYYVWASPLVDDFKYDQHERELRVLVAEHPDVAAAVPLDDEEIPCPTTTVGSTLLWDYPRKIQVLAMSLKEHPLGELPEEDIEDEVFGAWEESEPGTQPTIFG